MYKTVKILLIEDDEDDYILTEYSLRELRFIEPVIDWAQNAEEGLQKLTNQQYDLCLLDYQLGGVTGVDVLLKASESSFDVPVIMLTGQDQDEAVKAALDAGATDYLLKAEINSSRFGRAVRYALARGEMQQERLERLKLESESRAKDRFLAHLSHELRTPLTSIIGYTELLLNSEKAAPLNNELQVVLRNGEYLLTLLNDVLDLSKVSAQKLELEIAQCHLPELIKEVLALSKTLAKAKNLNLKVDVSKPLPEYIQTDAKRLRQVLINLLGNAIKFTSEGYVSLTVRETYVNESPRLIFSVIDTGMGISEQNQSLIFQPFMQVDDLLNKNNAGTGLGLAISQQLVQSMGGDIHVESTKGVGSCFSFTIDVGELDPEQFTLLDLNGELNPYEPSEAKTYKGRVLVVDDLKDIRNLMHQHLTRLGLSVERAENGQVACDKMLQAQQEGKDFDAIFMDLHMPVMDGYQCVRMLRKNGFSGKVIALTAAARTGLDEELRQIGFSYTLAKPINIEILTEYLEKALQPVETVPSKSNRMLLVEDDIDAAQATRMMLESLGASVDVVHNGADCIDLLKSGRSWDSAILDLNLPDMNGLQLVGELHGALPELIIYILSGEEPDEAILQHYPVQKLLQKPLFLADLASLVKA